MLARELCQQLIPRRHADHRPSIYRPYPKKQLCTLPCILWPKPLRHYIGDALSVLNGERLPTCWAAATGKHGGRPARTLPLGCDKVR